MKGKVVQELHANSYFRLRLFLEKSVFLWFKSSQGGNSACLQAKAYHIADSPFKVGVVLPSAARAASISAVAVYPGGIRAVRPVIELAMREELDAFIEACSSYLDSDILKLRGDRQKRSPLPVVWHTRKRRQYMP